MPKRNFDSNVIIQRLQNRVHSRNLYINNTTGQTIIHNPQTTDRSSAMISAYRSGAQTEYFRGLKGGETISLGGIFGVPPAPKPPPTIPTPPYSLLAIPSNLQLSITFSQGYDGGKPIINYQSSINGGEFIPFDPAITSGPIIFTGLINNTPYSIRLKTVNILGASSPSNAVVGIPSNPPDAPTIIRGTAGENKVFLAVTPAPPPMIEPNEVNPVINYQYSTDSGATFQAFNPAVTISPITISTLSSNGITPLSNGITYAIQLKEVNAAGIGSASSSFLITPVPGGSSTFDGNGLQLYLDGANGGSTSSWVDTSGTQNNCTFFGTPSFASTDGGIYTFDGTQYGQLPPGFNDFSGGLTILSFVHFSNTTLGYTPIINLGNQTNTTTILFERYHNYYNYYLNIFVLNNSSLDVNENIVNDVVQNVWAFYATRLDGVNVLLQTNTTTQLTANSALPQNIIRNSNYIAKDNYGEPLFQGNIGIIAVFNSALTNTQILAFFDLYKRRYFNLPSPPTNLIATPGSQQLSIAFIEGNNGGSSIINYLYSINNGVFIPFNPSKIASPVLITGLTNGITYSIRLKALTIIGESIASNAISSIPNPNAPNIPTIVYGTSGENQVFIGFTITPEAGNPIINYQYSTDSGTTFRAFNPTVTTGPVTISTLSSNGITPLSNGTTYTIQLKAVNAKGSGAASNSFLITPVPGGSSTFGGNGLQLYLDGANGGSTSLWVDTSGNLKDCTFFGGSPIYSSLYSGIYTFTGTQYGIVPPGFYDFSDGLTILSFVNFGVPNSYEAILNFTGNRGSNSILFDRYTTIDNQFISTPTNDLNIYVANNAGEGEPPLINSTFANVIINNTWGFYATRINSTDILLQKNTTRQIIPNTTHALPNYIARTSNYIGRNDSRNSFFNGNMGIIAVYSTALTDEQITAFYNLYKGRYFEVPTAPTNLVAIVSSRQVSITFIQSSSGTSPIINYEYSINNGVFIPCNPIVTVSPVLITGLTNGITYIVRLKAINDIGSSNTSNSVSFTPIGPTVAPIITSGTAGENKVFIGFTPPSNGGSPITNYQYSTDSGATFRAFNPTVTTSPVTISTLSSNGITPLSNGITYPIQLKAINGFGSGSSSNSFKITPVPGGSSTFDGNGLQLYLDGANGGSTTTWIDTSGKLKNCAFTNNPSFSSDNSGIYTFTGIQYGQIPPGFNNFSDGLTILSFINFGINGRGWQPIIDLGNSTNSNHIIFERYYNKNDLNIWVVNNSVIQVNNTLQNVVIDNTWAFYATRLDGTNVLLQANTTTQLTANTTKPETITRTLNYIGKDNYGDPFFQGKMGIVAIFNTALTNTKITEFYNLYKGRYFQVPSAPTNLGATSSTQQLSIAFTQGSTGGSPILNYEYSTDGVTFLACNPAITASPVIITTLSTDGTTRLTNGTTYIIKLKTVSVYTSAESASITAVPNNNPPTAPTALTVSTTSQTVAVYFTQGFNGGSSITNYQYSTDDGVTFFPCNPAIIVSPVTITTLSTNGTAPLTNGTTYLIQLKAVNAVGASVASASVTAIPSTTPSAPTTLSSISSSQQLSISFTAGFNGGSAITNYQYSTDNGSTFLAFSPAVVASPVTITTLSTNGTTRLTNGVTYTIQLKAVNSKGAGAASLALSAVPA